MDEHRKNAYRHLLYVAMLEARGVEWVVWHPWRLLNPFSLGQKLRYVARAGAVADWLHNLAQFSTRDFEGFDEDRFWKEYDRLVRRHGDPFQYRWHFDHRLNDRRL